MASASPQEKAEYAAAAMIDYAVRHRSSGGLRHPVEELRELLGSYYKVAISEDHVDEATKILTELQLGEVISVGRARPYFLLESQQFDRLRRAGWNDLSAGSRFGQMPVLRAYNKLGAKWLDESLEIVFAEETKIARAAEQERFNRMTEALLGLSKRPRASLREVPAADRIVSLDHNDPRVREAVSDARKLAIDLVANNDVGNLTTDEVLVAANEVNSIADALERPNVRLPAFADRTKSTLSWIGKEAAGAVVGTAALALLALIASILGFTF